MKRNSEFKASLKVTRLIKLRNVFCLPFQRSFHSTNIVNTEFKEALGFYDGVSGVSKTGKGESELTIMKAPFVLLK